ncbi:MAG TPA: DUF881 domain-containing protein [Jatrophihabitans sp.]|nr:DUF881 domain-containing protein [Jatrophihabitans sp.]
MPAANDARRWRVLVPVVCLAAGVVFAVSARDSSGTVLRVPGGTNLADTVRAAEKRAAAADHVATSLQRQVERATRQAAGGNGAVARAQGRVTPLIGPSGLQAVSGPGLEVVLDDAPAGADSGVDPNQLVVHQSDLQSVVNALWAGGAEAMAISGERIVATSAVRCVGPTLLLNGQVFSPPYRVMAIGPARPMLARLAASPGVQLFEEAASYYGLGYTVETKTKVDLPAYNRPITLAYARAGK